MIAKLAKKIFGSRNQRILTRYKKQLAAINAFEPALQALNDQQLQQKTQQLRDQYAAGSSLKELLPEAFAVVREASTRTLAMRHFDVQMIGGMVLNDSNIAEMRTGEGKTLVATLPVYLNAISGRGVHVITVNDYLARRDAEWMSKLYNFLGLSVGVILAGINDQQRRDAYLADITYGTNNEFGFDYLRDNMKFTLEQKVQRDLHFAVVDEVDSILIDEARTPLIISGPTSDSSELYTQVDKIVPNMVRQETEEDEGDYLVDEKARQVFLSDQGHQHIEELLLAAGLLDVNQSLYDTANISLLHHVNASLRAHALFQKNVDYIVRNDEVIIVDEFTGRTMPGRRWSEGLHQAVEAKEGVKIQNENQTLASITFQNYFRLYEKLSGMTGTADTEAFEFQQIYGLEVVVIPTHKPMLRDDRGDAIYMTMLEKYDAIIEDIKACKTRGQPVLVGTASIDSSEHLSKALEQAKIEHQVLNAKHHASESEIIIQAGMPGKVTIATNMAGRGTDIVLGGNIENDIRALEEQGNDDQVMALKAEWQQRHDAVIAAGGLHIIGTERHESRRIDNQLRGRSGRQGDPGSSRFYLSLEDSLMRIFASERMRVMMQKLGMEEGESIEHPWVTKAIENAQRKVESHNFDIRKHLLEYDDVASDQRKVIYEQRSDLMSTDNVAENINAIRHDVVETVISSYIPPGSMEEQWDVTGLTDALKQEFETDMPIQAWLDADDNLHEETLRQRIQDNIESILQQKSNIIGEDLMRTLEKDVMLQMLDNKWKEHLASMDYLRQSVGLRGYAQKNPKQEYKREAFDMFQQMLEDIKLDTITFLARVEFKSAQEAAPIDLKNQETALEDMQLQHAQADNMLQTPAESEQQADSARAPQSQPRATPMPLTRSGKKVGRNDPCPCGSGKKYKQCCGKLS
ncbi:MAG: preprotein translocase subunit SecA [Candidatus Thioglobus sp.]|nr:MAG: preprotein translocase subunit SecA [Candidatus Thioglobus sp.]|tara:strand:+ start:1395 stop:4142 length:2748 start_codon:yes stop_codon:yes gene_type:complete